MVLTGEDLAAQNEKKKKGFYFLKIILGSPHFRDSIFAFCPQLLLSILYHTAKEAFFHQKLSQINSIGNCVPHPQARVFLQSLMPYETDIQHTFILTWCIQNLLWILILSKCPGKKTKGLIPTKVTGLFLAHFMTLPCKVSEDRNLGQLYLPYSWAHVDRPGTELMGALLRNCMTSDWLGYIRHQWPKYKINCVSQCRVVAIPFL